MRLWCQTQISILVPFILTLVLQIRPSIKSILISILWHGYQNKNAIILINCQVYVASDSVGPSIVSSVPHFSGWDNHHPFDCWSVQITQVFNTHNLFIGKYTVILRFLWRKNHLIKRTRRPVTIQDKILPKTYLIPLYTWSKIYKELFKCNSKKLNNLIEKWIQDVNRYLSKEDTQMAHNHMKKCLTHYVIKKTHIAQM